MNDGKLNAMKRIHDYISSRYERWLDYSVFHCTQACIPDEAIDVLNEVLCSLLSKDKKYLIGLLDAKKDKYTELDFFVLKMIKLNVTSPTSPYRNKYKSLPTDENVDYSKLEIIDDDEEAFDEAGEKLRKMHLVREIFESLDLSPFARRVFHYRFFEGGKLNEFPEKKSLQDLYDTYSRVEALIRKKINGEVIF